MTVSHAGSFCGNWLLTFITGDTSDNRYGQQSFLIWKLCWFYISDRSYTNWTVSMVWSSPSSFGIDFQQQITYYYVTKFLTIFTITFPYPVLLKLTFKSRTWSDSGWKMTFRLCDRQICGSYRPQIFLIRLRAILHLFRVRCRKYRSMTSNSS